MDRAEIKDLLDQQGIEYDGRLSDDKLLALLDKATAGDVEDKPKAKADDDQTEFRVLRDYWPSENERVRKGAIVVLPMTKETMQALQRNAIEVVD